MIPSEKKEEAEKTHSFFLLFPRNVSKSSAQREKDEEEKKVICRKQKQNFRDYFRGVSFDAPLLFASSIHTRNQIHRNCIFIGVYDADRTTLFIR